MRMDKKTLALPMVILIALSIVGLGVAHWTDLVTIEGTVKMSTLTVAFTEIETFEYKRINATALDPTEGGKPWVCNTTSYLDEYVEDPHTEKWGYKKLYINITNAYPCYEVHQTFIIKALGELPADVYAFNVTDCTGQLTWVQNMTALPEFRGWFKDADNKTIMTLRVVDAVLPYQLEPCEENKMEIDIHIEQDAEECHTYCFVFEILYTQPN